MRAGIERSLARARRRAGLETFGRNGLGRTECNAMIENSTAYSALEFQGNSALGGSLA